MKTWLWWFLHNAIAHPLMGIFQHSTWPIRLHDWTSFKAELSQKPKVRKDVELTTGRYLVTRPLNLDEKACLLTDLMGMKNALYLVEDEMGLEPIGMPMEVDRHVRTARGKFLERFQIMLTEHFSEEEISGLIAFYQTPTGIAYSRKQAETMKKMSDMMGSFVNDLTSGQ